MRSLNAVDLKAWYEGCWPLGCPDIAYKNMTQMQLALYEWSAAKYGFGANITAFPAVLLREKEKQAKAARAARGEPEPDSGVVPAAPAAKRHKPGDFMAKADRIAPQGIHAPLPAATTPLAAAVPIGTPPWGPPLPAVPLNPLHNGAANRGGGVDDHLDLGGGEGGVPRAAV